MTTAEFLLALGRVNLAMAAAIILVIALRAPLRRWLGARAAYRLWLLPLLAAVAVLAPPRVVTLQASLPAPPPLTVIASPVATAPAAEFLSSPVARSPRDPWPLLLAIWLAGAAVFGAHLAVRQRRFQRLTADGLAGPAVVGLIRPRIVLPDDFETRFSPQEQAAVVAHEVEHLRAQHPRANALLAGLSAACWFNPLVHLGAHLVRVDQELACDAAVIEHRPQMRRLYAETLLKTQLAATPLPLGCYWPAGAEHPLTMRVEMLGHVTPDRRLRLTGAVVTAMLTAGSGLAAWAAQPPQMRIEAVAPTPPSTAQAPLPVVNPGASMKARARAAPVTPPRIIDADRTAPIHLTGPVVAADWTQPRAMIHVADEGSGKTWTVETGSSNTLRRGGIAEGIVGRQVEVEAFQAKDKRCTPECKALMRSMTFPDGRKVFLGPATSEKMIALGAGDWRRAASLGATAADVVRALQEKGRYRDLNAWQAVVTISPDNLVEAIPMKPLPPIDGAPASTRTAGLAGSGFSFTAKPGTVILYPSYADTFDAPARAAEGRLAQANLEIARSELEDARRKFEVGLITRIDLMKYERDVLAAEVRAKDAGAP